MTNLRDRFENPEVFEGGILKDGATARVHMGMRDSADGDGPLSPAEMARRLHLLDAERRRQGPVVTDSRGDSLFGLRRPGFRFVTGGSYQDQRDQQHMRDVRAKAYADYRHDAENSWRTPNPPTGVGEHGHRRNQQAGDACTVNGKPGTLVERDDGVLVCQIDDEFDGEQIDSLSLADLQTRHRRITDAAYSAYEREISEAWKTSK